MGEVCASQGRSGTKNRLTRPTSLEIYRRRAFRKKVRVSTVLRRADQILVIEAGRIIERGTHESLHAAGGRYYALYTKQHGIETNLFLAPGEGDVPQEESAAAQREPSADNEGDDGLSSAIRLLRSQDRQALILRQEGSHLINASGGGRQKPSESHVV
jgi:hypothetical protein